MKILCTCILSMSEVRYSLETQYKKTITMTTILLRFLSVILGGRLFSKLHKLRNEKAKEHPECIFPGQRNAKMKASHTSPTVSADYQQNASGRQVKVSQESNYDSTDTDFQTPWHETQQRVDSCRTHSYIEETGCLQNTRSTFFNKLESLSLHSGPSRTQPSTRIHPPIPSLCLHTAETQEQLTLPLSCARVSQTLDVMSRELNKKKAGTGLIECSSDFEVAWKATEQMLNCEKTNLYAVSGSDHTSGQTPPHTNQTSFKKTGIPNSQNSPAILYLPLHCQTQIHGKAAWDTSTPQQGSFLGDNPTGMSTNLQHRKEKNSPTSEEKNGMVVITSTDRAVFSEHTDSKITLDSSWTSASFCNSSGGKQASILQMSESKHKGEKNLVREGAEEACGVLSKVEKGAPVSGWSWFGNTDKKKREMLKSEGSDGQGEDQIIEVDGWCHLPRIPVKTQKPEKAVQCWGLPEGEVRVWGAQILLALESLHEQGILCRDLNPRNVLLTSNGKP